MSGIEPQKKTRFSRLLGGSKREKSPPEHPAAFTDSAYASSDITTPGTVNPVDRPNDVPNDAIIPAEKDSEIANIDKDRNLGMKPSTGEVFDRDTGEVVTVVTTTTTTTTTTTRKPGSKKPNVHKDVHTDVQEHTQNQPAINTANADAGTVDPNSDQSGIIAEMPATPATPGETVHTGHNLPLAAPPGEASKLLKQSPDIPARNANRRSGEYAHNPTASNNNNNNNNYNTSSTFVPQAHASDVSPEGSYFPTGNTPPLSPTRGANYSYPTHHTGREPQESTSHIPTQHQPLTHQNSTLTHQSSTRSTLSDLRAAAKGLHVSLFPNPLPTHPMPLLTNPHRASAKPSAAHSTQPSTKTSPAKIPKKSPSPPPRTKPHSPAAATRSLASLPAPIPIKSTVNHTIRIRTVPHRFHSISLLVARVVVWVGMGRRVRLMGGRCAPRRRSIMAGCLEASGAVKRRGMAGINRADMASRAGTRLVSRAVVLRSRKGRGRVGLGSCLNGNRLLVRRGGRRGI